MANKASSGARSPLSLVVAMALCCFFYVLGAWQGSGYGKGDRIAAAVSRQTACGDGSAAAEGLSFETHHGGAAGINASTSLPFGADAEPPTFAPCAAALADHTPCHDQDRAMKFPRKNMVYRERHCPADGERLRCLMPAPPGYVTPFPWPQSRDYVPFANAPYKSLTVEKAVQNWVQYEGSVFRFPGGGTQFPPRRFRPKKETMVPAGRRQVHRPARFHRPLRRRPRPHRPRHQMPTCHGHDLVDAHVLFP
ncbi:probable methyltransferase PMT14 isoform X2 [Miscanthus floridulus]|uniref:probable methyltransferase PMT14 isoform X2 n=1 Tax=Miscanthus floridulus TaxID=154761 RepID=UPI003458E9CC